MPAHSTTNDASVQNTITRSPWRPSSDSAAPKATASGCSVGERYSSKLGRWPCRISRPQISE
jgi:hypothetical protein